MAAKTPSATVTDTVHGQRLSQCQMFVLPFTNVSNGDTWTPSTAELQLGIVKVAAAVAPASGLTVGAEMNASTKVVTFATATGSDPQAACELIVWYGGEAD